MRPIDADKLLQIYRSEQSRMEERQCERINKANSKSGMLLELECRELEKLSTWISFCEDIIIDINNAPTIEPYGTWIPVSSGKLPEEPEENPEFDGKPLELYLVSVNDEEYPFRAFWNGKCFTDGAFKVNAVAWMPLPEPYREEKKDEKDS